MIDSRRKQLDDETMAQIRHEIGEIVTRYVDIEPENVEIKSYLRITYVQTIQTKELQVHIDCTGGES